MRPSGYFISPHLALGAIWVWDPAVHASRRGPSNQSLYYRRFFEMGARCRLCWHFFFKIHYTQNLEGWLSSHWSGHDKYLLYRGVIKKQTRREWKSGNFLQNYYPGCAVKKLLLLFFWLVANTISSKACCRWHRSKTPANIICSLQFVQQAAVLFSFIAPWCIDATTSTRFFHQRAKWSKRYQHQGCGVGAGGIWVESDS